MPFDWQALIYCDEGQALRLSGTRRLSSSLPHHRHRITPPCLLTLSLFLSDRLLASPLSHALLFPTVWLNRSQYTFDGTALSDCNKARIASTWSANELWSSAPQSGWSQNPAAACSPGPYYLLVVGVPVGGVVLVIVFLVVLRRRRRRFAGASTSERPAQELGSAPPPTLVIAEATHSANAPETTQDVV